MTQFETPLQPTASFLGYCLKEAIPRPEWLKDPRVQRICSISECMSKRPPNWIHRWNFNRVWCYDKIETAYTDVVDRDRFFIFAYIYFPLWFDPDGTVFPAAAECVFGARFPTFGKATLTPEFRFLGYDIIGIDNITKESLHDPLRSATFSHSPLSCNHCSVDHPINENCLLTNWSDAVHAAHRFALDQPEPGPYVIIGVYERRNQ